MEKSVMVTAFQSGMSHTIIPTVLKNKNKVMEAVKESVSYRQWEKKIENRLCHHKETSNDLKWRPGTEANPQRHNDHAKAKVCLGCWKKEQAGPDYDVEFTTSSCS